MMMMAIDEELLLQFSWEESKVAPLRSTLILLSQGVVDWPEDCRDQDYHIEAGS